MCVSRWRRVPPLALCAILAACGPGSGDAGPAPDLAPVDASSAADSALASDGPVAPADLAGVKQCEEALLAGWKAHPPSLGIARAAAAKSYDAVVAKLMSDFGVPGGAVAVVKDGKLRFAKGYGFSDRDAPAPARADDLFRIASLSKQITAAEILALVDAGKLGLDEKVTDVLPDLAPLPGHALNPQWKSITVRHLLNHTGGWNRDKTFDPMFRSRAISTAAGIPGPADCPTIIRYMMDQPLTHAPGSTYCYSNFGYCLLGRVVEKRGGGPYQDQVRGTLLTPAGVPPGTAIGHTFEAMRDEREVTYYGFPGEPLVLPVFPNLMGLVPAQYGGYYLEAMDANGAWITSPIDLLRFQVHLDGRRGPSALTPASRAAMIANPNVPECQPDGTTTPWPDGYWYGFGWEVNKYGNWWHTGSLPGTTTEVVRAANGYGWAAFFNIRPQDSNGMFSRLDGDLWTALQGVPPGGFGDDDFFDQYGDFTPWANPQDFNVALVERPFSGQYAARIDGRLAAGSIEYRAEFVPLHPGAVAEPYAGLDCPSYQAEAEDHAARGFQLQSVQQFTDGGGVRRFQAVWQKLP